MRADTSFHEICAEDCPLAEGIGRRDLLRQGALTLGFASTVSAGGCVSQVSLGTTPVAEPGKRQASARTERAYQVRLRAAEAQRALADPEQTSNGDEQSLPGRIACFSKCLPHNELGEVDGSAYGFLLAALRSGEHDAFEKIPLGGYRKLANPQAAYAVDLVGCDASQLALAPAPGFASAEQAAETVELYWQALMRDIPFSEYETHPLAQAACDDLSKMSALRSPRQSGRVTPDMLFRGSTGGDLRGPYLSQFLLKPIP